MVVVAAIAAVVVSVTGASSAKNNAKVASSSSAPARHVDGTLLKGTLPANGTPASGGTIVAGQLEGQTPTDISPIINDATCSTDTFQFVADMYIPLYYGPKGGTPALDNSLSAAEPAKYSNGDKTVTITVKPGLKWSDGKPVDGEDVAFDYYMLLAASKASPANWCQYSSPTLFPFNVKSVSYKGNTVTMHLKSSVNPTWFTDNQLQDTNGGMYPLPSTDWNVNAKGQHLTDWATNPKDALAIYQNMNNTNGADSPKEFATSPLWKVVDGGFKLTSFNTTNDSYVLSPNTSYGLKPKPNFTFKENTYTSSTALVDAMESGSVEIGQIDPGTQLPIIPTLNSKGFSVFGAPEWGWFGGFFNFKDTTDHFNKVIAQPYMRGVFAELTNETEITNDIYHGWAVPAYGPVASAPDSPYLTAASTKANYPYNPSKAVATLKAHGWSVKPGGQTTCAKAGSGAGDCGAGIPAGTPIKFVWANQPESAAATGVLESYAFASEAKKAAGVDVTFQTKTFDFLTSEYNDQNPAAKKYQSSWGVNNYGGINTDYYPTEEGVMNTTGALNMGAYADPTANKLMVQSTTSPSLKAIQSEVKYFAEQMPVLYMPVQDWITAVSKKVGGTTDGFLQMTQQQLNATLLWVNK
ncbi:MAG TPA: ABC transporter substrate-binding protein [Solirubrobacteraceae bacterium]|jgi:peptide/nickel transport system substrate-binding protein|nr:ABC transporter substrate-binding protein [Solirubrobacteraceae bacterium]